MAGSRPRGGSAVFECPYCGNRKKDFVSNHRKFCSLSCKYNGLRRPVGKFTVKDVERFSKKFTIVVGGCWQWHKLSGNDEYGRFSIATSKSALAHRVMYELVNGPTPLHIDHTCRNTACVNPAHLEAVTQQENNRRQQQASKERKQLYGKVKR